jgi:hypothetical protein
MSMFGGEGQTEETPGGSIAPQPGRFDIIR